ncbi:MAG TPA: cysteine-rich CWC family protein [Leptospiraceae bacterium]|nr:cysteine-rich CWC family protein [Leptospiraceae bacterium]HMW04445.1 cysteine-rich CWC family protein [Leptospiraceae bacterium]HMX35628.1 cysteine-rich CWC family protein [Leptospiraceae bacterium]HMY30631.1 cysteine-rich CWC family protein [Leptospiraceae bacterium]HMZ64427.1 cysteine-rich CWC family protein [Leptospiraceae bacterium]
MKVKTCPACKTEFICNMESIEECQCGKVVLTALQREKIANLYQDCICKNCLVRFNLEEISPNSKTSG